MAIVQLTREPPPLGENHLAGCISRPTKIRSRVRTRFRQRVEKKRKKEEEKKKIARNARIDTRNVGWNVIRLNLFLPCRF